MRRRGGQLPADLPSLSRAGRVPPALFPRFVRRQSPSGLLGYALNTVVAFTYNVGDTPVFYLPGHLFPAFLAGVAIAPFGAPDKARAPTVGGRTVFPRVGGRTLLGPPVMGIAGVVVCLYVG